MAERRSVLLLTSHADTAELYGFTFEQAGFEVRTCKSLDEAVPIARESTPLAIVVHFGPGLDPTPTGPALRQAAPDSVMLGLFSVHLPVADLQNVLETFDDVVMIPCAPDALVSRIESLASRKRRQ